MVAPTLGSPEILANADSPAPCSDAARLRARQLIAGIDPTQVHDEQAMRRAELAACIAMDAYQSNQSAHSEKKTSNPSIGETLAAGAISALAIANTSKQRQSLDPPISTHQNQDYSRPSENEDFRPLYTLSWKLRLAGLCSSDILNVANLGASSRDNEESLFWSRLIREGRSYILVMNPCAG